MCLTTNERLVARRCNQNPLVLKQCSSMDAEIQYTVHTVRVCGLRDCSSIKNEERTLSGFQEPTIYDTLWNLRFISNSRPLKSN